MTMVEIEAQNKPCALDTKTLQFVGTPLEQARCLLRTNKIGGKVDDLPLKKLPDFFEKHLGKKTKNNAKEKLRKYLTANKIEEKTIGGNLDLPLSSAKLPNGETIQAQYFMLHDTSTPNLKDAAFPLDLNEKTWRFNTLEMWLKMPVAHVFVNRLGESITTVEFSETLGEKRWGTKFARDILKADAKGLQLHIELVQPRRRDATLANPENDVFAPTPGFTEAQYEKLALLYVAASVRRGSWLIPAYHACMDAGIPGAHDDPQNFELEKFDAKLSKLEKDFKF